MPPKLFLQIPVEDVLEKKSIEILREFGLNEKDYQRIKEVISKMKHFKKEDLQYNMVDKKLPIEFELIEDENRKMLHIKKPVDKLFYQSKGESREDPSIKNIWFPFEGYDETSFSRRLKKCEDKYIRAFENLGHIPLRDEDIINLVEMAKNTDLYLYGRLLDYTIASISATLSEYKI